MPTWPMDVMRLQAICSLFVGTRSCCFSYSSYPGTSRLKRPSPPQPPKQIVLYVSCHPAWLRWGLSSCLLFNKRRKSTQFSWFLIGGRVPISIMPLLGRKAYAKKGNFTRQKKANPPLSLLWFLPLIPSVMIVTCNPKTTKQNKEHTSNNKMPLTLTRFGYAVYHSNGKHIRT